jgi:hypothetical protein
VATTTKDDTVNDDRHDDQAPDVCYVCGDTPVVVFGDIYPSTGRSGSTGLCDTCYRMYFTPESPDELARRLRRNAQQRARRAAKRDMTRTNIIGGGLIGAAVFLGPAGGNSALLHSTSLADIGVAVALLLPFVVVGMLVTSWFTASRFAP